VTCRTSLPHDHGYDVRIAFPDPESQMPAIARAITRALPNTPFSIKPFKSEAANEFVLFCGTGFLALLLLVTQDLDIGTGFF
jgi:hypothetical protein